MAQTPKDPTLEKLDEISVLLKHLVAIELWRGGASHEQIGKHIHVAKAAVGTMLKGVAKE
jgi:hypothetical protein